MFFFDTIHIIFKTIEFLRINQNQTIILVEKITIVFF